MKKLIIIVLLFLSFTITGCDKEPDKEPSSELGVSDVQDDNNQEDDFDTNSNDSNEEQYNQSSDIEDYDDNGWKGLVF